MVDVTCISPTDVSEQEASWIVAPDFAMMSQAASQIGLTNLAGHFWHHICASL